MDQYMPLVGIPSILPMDVSATQKNAESDKEPVYYFATLSPSQVRGSMCLCAAVCVEGRGV